MALREMQQFGIKVEATEGTEESLVAADFVYGVKDVEFSLASNEYDRSLNRGTLTMQKSLAGQRMQSLSATVEWHGGGAAAETMAGRVLRGCGFARTQLRVINIQSPSGGSFAPGDLVGNNASQGSATKLARVAYYENATQDRLVFHPISGGDFAGGETIHNYTDAGASAAVSGTPGLANAGNGYRPVSETDSVLPDSVTCEVRVDGLKHTCIGARGDGNLRLALGEPVLVRGEFRGPPVLDTGDTPRSGTRVTGLTNPGSPAAVRNIPLALRVDGTDFKPVLTDFEVRFGNSLADRPTITDDCLAESGYLATRIDGRSPRVSLTIEHEPADFEAISLKLTDAVFGCTARVGTPTGTSGLLVVHMPECQIVGDVSHGANGNILTDQIEIAPRGDDNDELWFWQVFLS